jgi:hypothetical protein
MKYILNKRHLNISCPLINVAEILKMHISFYVTPCILVCTFHGCDSVLKLFLNRMNLELRHYEPPKRWKTFKNLQGLILLVCFQQHHSGNLEFQ